MTGRPRAASQPTARAILVLAAAIPVACLPIALGSGFVPAWVGGFAGIVLLVAADALLAPPSGGLRVETTLPEAIALSAAGASGSGGAVLSVRVASRARDAGTAIEALADVGPILEPTPVARFRLGGDGTGETSLPLVPRRRGRAAVPALWLRYAGPLGLVAKIVRVPLDASVPVETDLAPVRSAALRFASSPDFRSGQKTELYPGDGSEFDSLRDYAPGLDRRAIDWKASARHRRLKAREYRAERNHAVVLAIDAGRLMCEPLGGVPRLDRAISAALELAFVAQKTGDRVGLYSFDERPRAFSAPEAGMAAFRRVRRLAADVEYTTAETNYALALTALSAKLPRRSLVVVFTEFVDTVSAEIMIERLGGMARRHLVLFVALRDPEIAEIADAAIAAETDLHRAIVAQDLARERRLVLERLRRAGVLVVDARAETVSTRLVNRYLDVRRRELV